MKVLVTGAAGHIGSAVTRVLLERGHEVRGFVHDPKKAARRLPELDVELVAGDVREEAAVRRAVEGMDAVVHLVAIAIERRGATYEDVNDHGTRVVLAAMAAAGVGRLVYMGQLGSSADLPYRFLRSKALAQAAVQGSDRVWTVLRPSVVFGPTDEFAATLARFLKVAPLFPVPGDGRARFQPIDRDDVAEIVANVLPDELAVGGVYELGGPETLTFDQMLERILEAMDAHRAIVHVPIRAMHPLVGVLERVLPNPGVTTSLLDLLAVDNTTDDSRTEDLLGRPPTAFRGEALAYLRAIGVGDAVRYFAGLGVPAGRETGVRPSPDVASDVGGAAP